MLEGVRFSLYRNIVARFMTRGFESHPVEPLAQPVDTTIEHVGHDELFPELPLPPVRVATSFLPNDDDAKRRRLIWQRTHFLAYLVKLQPKRTPSTRCSSATVRTSAASSQGPLSFAVTLFSHPAEEVSAIAARRMAAFDPFDFEPDQQFARRGTTETPFPYPYRDNMLELWSATLDYVTSYVDLFYPDDESVRADPALAAWADALDDLLPRPLTRPDGGLTRDWVARLCATVVHLSTVEHDVLNNVVWDYSTFSWIVPTVAPETGEQMDQLRAFDLITTLFLTWRPFNMLLDSHVESMALDAPGRQVMLAWLDRLREIQAAMEARGSDPSLAYPAHFNISVTN